jgi:hypothetical protein
MREKLIELLESTVPKEEVAAYGEVYVSTSRIADHLIANGVTIQKWIPVSEPPKENGCYLVTVKHWLDGKPVAREAFWNSVDWLSCEKRQEITPRVTHWMPLPEPPKGE